jgi:hypoxanthine phosphoribosyltransferase
LNVEVKNVGKAEIDEVLFSQEDIQLCVRELARELSKDYEDNGLLLVGILKGAFIFLADLARCMSIPVCFDFMACSSYGSAMKTSGVVRIRKDLDTDIKDRHVVIVEDIIDTGLALSYLLKNLEARGPASLEICALLNKKHVEGKVDLPIKYEGFSIPDVFVVGYGLDYDQKYRNLPYIATFKR